MKDIRLQSIRLKQFRSYKDETILFSQTTGLKFLCGLNNKEPRLGSNGAGKSTLWNGVCWVIYGTGVKNERTASLISWGSDSLWGELHLQIDGVEHIITRSGPPARILLNGQPATQSEIDVLLGLSKLRFLHSIIFGQAVRLFPDLSVPERGELFDEVLGLDVWNKASELAGKKQSALDKSLIEKKNAVAFIDGNINGLPTNASIQQQIDEFEKEKALNVMRAKSDESEWRAKQDAAIKAVQESLLAWESEQNSNLELIADNLDKQEQKKEEISSKIAQLEALLAAAFVSNVSVLEEEQKKEQQEYYRLSAEHKREYADSCFWEANTTCPSCAQPIDISLREEKQRKAKETISSLDQAMSVIQTELGALASQLSAEREALREHDKKVASQTAELSSYRRELKSVQEQINRLETEGQDIVKELEAGTNPWSRQLSVLTTERNPYTWQVNALETQENPHIATLNVTQQKRRGLEASRRAAADDCVATQNQATIAEYWKQGFKKIRLYFVKQILTALQIEIQSAISALGLSGWYISLSTETENKSGTIKLGIAIHVKSPDAEGEWEGWSGGETQRLRLAIAMGLASLIQRAAGVRYNTEVFDEPSNYLSVEGVEDLMQALTYRANSHQKSIWVVDHSAITYPGFKETWVVTKEKETGSHLQLVSEIN